jgi:uncharacterized membrane protein
MTPQQQAADFVSRLNDAILFPLIALLSGVAFLVFVYGAAEYAMNATNESARAEGRKHILFGIIGLFVMVSAFAILTLASGTFGLQDKLRCAENPSASGC